MCLFYSGSNLLVSIRENVSFVVLWKVAGLAKLGFADLKLL